MTQPGHSIATRPSRPARINPDQATRHGQRFHAAKFVGRERIADSGVRVAASRIRRAATRSHLTKHRHRQFRDALTGPRFCVAVMARPHLISPQLVAFQIR